MALALAVVAAAEAGRPLPPDAAVWLARGIGHHLEGGEPLERALSLDGAGGRRRARTLWRLQRRDAALRRAHALVAGASPWARSLALEAEVRRFAAIHWPRWRGLMAPPPGCSDLRAALWDAFAAGPPVPETARRLHTLCA